MDTQPEVSLRWGLQHCEGSTLSQPHGTPHLVSQMECALKCDPSLLCPQRRINVLSGLFRLSSSIKHAHAPLKARWRKTVHTKCTWNQCFVHIRIQQNDEEPFLDVYTHILSICYSVRLPVYLTGKKKKKKFAADKTKFSLVNDKGIYQSTKTKIVEDTLVELQSTSSPSTVHSCVLDMWADFAGSFSIIPVPSSELADKGSKLSLESWRRVTPFALRSAGSLQLRSFIRQ